jgi:hypothetical protein
LLSGVGGARHSTLAVTDVVPVVTGFRSSASSPTLEPVGRHQPDVALPSDRRARNDLRCRRRRRLPGVVPPPQVPAFTPSFGVGR